MSDTNPSQRMITLGVRLATLASLLMLTVTVALTVITIQREQVTFRTDKEAEADLLLNTLLYTTRDQLYRRDIDELDEITDVLDNEEYVSSAAIFDAQGYPLAKSDAPSPILADEPDPLGERLIAWESETPYLSWETGQLVAGRPVHIGNQTIGAIAITLSTAVLEQQIRQTTTQGVLIALAAIVVAVGLNFLSASRITGPLRELARAAIRMSAGDLSVRVPKRTRDEVGQLSGAFNEMASAIQARESELRELNESLERQVQERTQELRQQNEVLVQTNEELIAARKRAEEAVQLKSQFLANVSHELRTPLNAIMGYIQLMQMGIPVALPEPQQEQVQRMMRSSESLLTLINNLLDLAKIEAGRVELVVRPFSVQDWIQSVVRPLDILAQDKKLRVEVIVDEQLPRSIVGDAERLRQIVVNLVSNAIKFTDEGSIEIALNREGDDRWTITVRDTGIGIPSHAQEYIFEEFRQVDGTPTRQHGGTGLGLSIVRNLVLMMRGTIRLTSKIGEGSAFTVELPLLPAPVTDKTTEVNQLG